MTIEPALKRAVLAIAGAALLVRLPFMLGLHGARAGSDQVTYLELSDQILRQGRFETDYYTPGYSIFEAALRLIPGDAATATTVAQHLVGVALTAAIVVVAWRWFGRAAAILAGTLAALTPILVAHEHTLLPDFLFGTTAFAGAVALAAGLRREPADTRLLVAAGFLFGCAAWVKPAGVFLLLAGPLAALLTAGGVRAALRPAAAVTLALVVTITPWLARNALKYEHFGMSIQGGQTLFNRVFEVDDAPIPPDSRYAALARQVRVRSESTPEARFHKDFAGVLRERRGLDEYQAIVVLSEMARAAIWADPLDYATRTWRQLRYEVGHLDDFENAELLDELESRRPELVEGAVRTTWDVAQRAVHAWWLLTLNAAVGLVLLVTGPRARRVAASALFAVWLSVMLGTAMFHGGLWRYSVQVAPIAWILGSAGLAAVAGALWARVRTRRAA